MPKFLNESGLPMSVVDEYEGDKKNFDRYINDPDVDTSKNKKIEKINQTSPGVDIEGDEFFDIDQAVLDYPDDVWDVSGTEGFVESVQEGIRKLIRLVRNAFIFIYEIVFNKVQRVKYRYTNVESEIRSRGIKQGYVKYPKSAIKLWLRGGYPETGRWIGTSLDAVTSIYKKNKAAQDTIKTLTSSASVFSSKKESQDYVLKTAREYANVICPSHQPTYSSTDLLPGGKVIRVSYAPINNPLGTKVEIHRIQGQSPAGKSFIPETTAVSTIMSKALILIKLINEDHKSPSSLSRDFEKYVNGLHAELLKKGGVSPHPTLGYFNWVIGFQKRSISIVLQYVFGVIFAALEFCESNLG